MSAPLGDVLRTAITDFQPEHPEREPWHQPTLRGVELAITDNRRVVRLEVADRVKLRNLDHVTFDRDYLEPFDWTPAGWGIAP
jgi:hypothetical protein